MFFSSGICSLPLTSSSQQFPLFFVHSAHTPVSTAFSKKPQDINLPYAPSFRFGGKVITQSPYGQTVTSYI